MLSRISKFSHAGIYLILFLTPLLGWAQSNARGQTVTLFRLIPMPNLVGRDLDLADTLASYHSYAAWGLGMMVVAHALAAIWHHFVRGDQVLRSMLPVLPHPKRRVRPNLGGHSAYQLILNPNTEHKS
jgi:cytochrome b561